MNKSELIAAIAKKSKYTRAQVAKIINSFIIEVTQNLQKGVKIKLPGFVTISKVRRIARDGRDPRSGAIITIPAKNAAKFKVSTVLNNTLR